MRCLLAALFTFLTCGCAPRYYVQPPQMINDLSGDIQPVSMMADLTPTAPAGSDTMLAFLPIRSRISPAVGGQTLRDYYRTKGDSALLLGDGDIPDYTVASERMVTVTAYNSRRDQTDSTPWKTASGRLVHDGIIAYNDDSLPFGTLVMFPDVFENKIFVIEDRMNARYGTEHADIWTLRYRDAVAWGQKPMRMLILGEPRGESP